MGVKAKPASDPVAAPEFRAGQNVFAKIDGKKSGPFYVVQITEGMAALQGKVRRVVPVADLIAQG